MYVDYIELSVRPNDTAPLGFFVADVEQKGSDDFVAGMNWPETTTGPTYVD